MINKENLLYERVLNLNASAGTNYLRIEKVKPNRVLLIKAVSVENQSSNYTKLRIGIKDGNEVYNYFEDISPLNDELSFTTEEIILREGQQLQAELHGCTAGDVLQMYVHGYWQDPK